MKLNFLILSYSNLLLDVTKSSETILMTNEIASVTNTMKQYCTHALTPVFHKSYPYNYCRFYIIIVVHSSYFYRYNNHDNTNLSFMLFPRSTYNQRLVGRVVVVSVASVIFEN